jgi:hypothetical protein
MKRIKRIIIQLKALFKEPVKAIVIRRYTLTTGNVGELYINGLRCSDTLDTFKENMAVIKAVGFKDEFTNRQPEDTLLVDNKEYAGRRITAVVRNNWIPEW